MSELMTLEDVLKLLRKFVKEQGTQDIAADKIGITQPYLADILAGNRKPGPTVLNYFDIELVKVYRKK